MRTYQDGGRADDERLTSGERRKLSDELADKRATLADELLRKNVRDLLSREVYARGDDTYFLQQNTILKADKIRVSDKMDSCNIRTVLQILQTSARIAELANRC